MKVNTMRNLMIFGIMALPFTAAHSAEPIEFGTSFDVTDDTNAITYTEDNVNFIYGSNPISEAGFYQRSVTDKADPSKRYFQTIIADKTSTGATFISESFVRVGAGGAGGVATKQITNDHTTNPNGTLTSAATIYTDSFWEKGVDLTVKLSQSVTNSTTGADGIASASFEAGFDYTGDLDDLDAGGVDNDMKQNVTLLQTQTPADGKFRDRFRFDSSANLLDNGTTTTLVQLGKEVDLDTQVHLGSALTDQTFKYDYIDGNKVTAGGQAEFADTTVINWIAGDTIERVQLSQNASDAGDFGFIKLSDLAELGGTDDLAETYNMIDLTGVGSALDFAPGADPFAEDPVF